MSQSQQSKDKNKEKTQQGLYQPRDESGRFVSKEQNRNIQGQQDVQGQYKPGQQSAQEQQRQQCQGQTNKNC